MRKNIVASVSGLNVHNLSVEDVREAMDWRREIAPPCLRGDEVGETFNRFGLQKLAAEAVAYFEENGGCGLPWNLTWLGAPWEGLPSRRYFLNYEKGENVFLENLSKHCGSMTPIEYTARFCGWLKAAAELKGLKKVIRVNVGLGMCSPYTKINLFRFFEKWNSPGAVERQIWKVKKRANQILKPYGLFVSWENLGQAMFVSKAVGKAALWAAEWTVADYLKFYDNRFEITVPEVKKNERFYFLKLARGLAEMKNSTSAVQRWAVSRCFDGDFSSLREALSMSGRLVEDNTDGVKMTVDPTTTTVVHGVEVTVGWLESRINGFGDNGKQYLLCQKHTNRTFHSYYFGNLKYAVKEAISAWRRQSELEKKEADLVKFLKGEKGYCPLAYRRQSYDAGNCERGTFSWLKSRGWEEKNFIPGLWLIPHLDESRVRNTAMALYRSFVQN